MRNIVLVFAVVCFLSGCAIKPTGMNSQRSGLRGLGDASVTVSLDSIKNDADVSPVKTKVAEIAIAVQLFLKDGKLADLTIPEFTNVLRKLIPADYQFLFDIMIAQIQAVSVNIDKIGVNNIERINSVCVGLINGCKLYDMQYRPVTAPVAEAAAAVPEAITLSDVAVTEKSKTLKSSASAKSVKEFGVRLKAECRK